MNSVIGALRVVLGVDTAAWEDGLAQAQNSLRRSAKGFERVGGEIRRAGAALTVGLSAPIAAFGGFSLKTAGDFEAAMGRVGIATQASTSQLKEMRDLARQIGRDTIFGASEAAGAMEELGRSGVGASEILGGAAAATVDLAAANDTELAPSAAAVTDALTVFGKSAEDLPAVVNQITGAVGQSKFEFSDYQAGMAQAAARAAGLGVSFEDFNAVLAGTAAQFASGSDAGTSFGTFVQRLSPQSKEAAAAISQLGLRFYTASGALRPMSEIADELRQKLGGLTDKSRSEVLTKIFGSDAIRTAIGLMRLGGEGLDEISEKIGAMDAAAQSAQRMSGFNGQLKQLGGAIEELQIAIGDSGLLAAATALVSQIAGLIEKLAALPKGVLAAVTAIGLLAAVVGPTVLVSGAFVASLGVLSRSLALVPGLATASASALGLLRGAMAFLLSPWGLALTAAAVGLGVLANAIWGLKRPTEETTRVTGAALDVLQDYAGAVSAAAVATGEAREEALAAARAKREQVVATLNNVRALILEKEALLKSMAAQRQRSGGARLAAPLAGGMGFAWSVASGVSHTSRRRQAEADLAAAQKARDETKAELDRIDALLNAPLPRSPYGDGDRDVDLSGDARGRSKEELDRLREELALEHEIALAREQGRAADERRLEDRLETLRLSERLAELGVANAREIAGQRVEALRTAEQEREAREQTEELTRRQLDHELELARLAGDSATVRKLEREIDLRSRISDLVEYGKSEADAAAIAGEERQALDKAAVQGEFRQIFRDGFRAAFDGDLGDYFRDWIADRATKGLERALNSLADHLLNLLSQIQWPGAAGGKGGAGGGGLLGMLGRAALGAFTGGFGGGVSKKLKGFATGGSFTVGGRAGVDRNVVAFRATRGEMVNIRRPGERADQQGLTLVTNVYANDAVLASTLREEIAQAQVGAVQLARRVVGVDLARRQRSRMA